MRCPRCGSMETFVYDTEMMKHRPTRRRRMKCKACDERFITSEDYSERTLEEVKIYKRKTKPYRLTIGFEGMEEVLKKHRRRDDDEID